MGTGHRYGVMGTGTGANGHRNGYGGMSTGTGSGARGYEHGYPLNNVFRHGPPAICTIR